MTTIGFIGTGIMGGPMAANLVAAGYEVRAYARGVESRGRAERAGAALTADAATAAEGADAIITMLPDGPDVEQVLGGDGGLIERLTPGTLVIDMSTIAPAVSRSLHARGTARGVAVLDAPVSGGEAGAIEGTLSIMVGGDDNAFARAEPILSAMGNAIHLGSAGTGQLVKAANQLIVASNIQAIAEAILLLESGNVDLAPALEAISRGLAGSTVLDRRRAAFVEGDFRPGFRAELHLKDLRIVQSTALAAGLALPTSAVTAAQMRALVALGHGAEDHSALLRLARELNANA